MTTSEHADYTPTTEEVRAAWITAHTEPAWGGRADIAGRPKERIAEWYRWLTAHDAEVTAAALASTPSPAQPTEAGERGALAAILSATCIPDRIIEWEEFADAILAAGFRLAPSPVQGADDRPAQAEVPGWGAEGDLAIQGLEYWEANADNPATRVDCGYAREYIKNLHEQIATYQQSPQAALNEVPE